MSAFATAHAKVDGPVLVDVAVEVPTVIIDMPYASKNNFTGEKLYKIKACLLRPEAARALLDAQYEFLNTGYRLKMLDCYRPKSVSMKMWDFGKRHNIACLALGDACKKDNCGPAAPDCLWEPLTLYLSRTSIHSTGAAVDVTLVKNGKELDMGTPFDHFGPEARTNSATGKQLENRLMLKRVMERHGFRNYFREWWHYNYVSEGKFPPLDISFTDALKTIHEAEKTNEKTH
ncbi:MAG: M15 family metallopeptidase [bacterium]